MKTRTILLAVVALAAVAGAGAAAWLWFLPQSSTDVEEALPEAFVGARTLARGTFRGGDAVHHVEGSVRLLSGPEGAILRFENYSATSGPDVWVYLTRAETPVGTDDVEGGLRLAVPGGEDGGHATLRGDFNVPLPAGTDVSEWRAVAVWCDRFNVLFGWAPLAPE